MGEANTCIIGPEELNIVMGCKHCQRTLATTKDKFSLGLMVTEADGKEYRYFIGIDPPITCCGEDKIIIKTFDTESEVESEEKRVLDHLAAHNSTEGLPLIGFEYLGVN